MKYVILFLVANCAVYVFVLAITPIIAQLLTWAICYIAFNFIKLHFQERLRAMSLLLTFICIICTGYNLVSLPISADHSPDFHHPYRIPTATSQFSHLNNISVHQFLKPRRTSVPLNIHFSSVVTLLVVLSGDINLNPGPSSSNTTAILKFFPVSGNFNLNSGPPSNIALGTLNIRSLFALNRPGAITGLLHDHDIHILALSETLGVFGVGACDLRTAPPIIRPVYTAAGHPGLKP